MDKEVQVSIWEISNRVRQIAFDIHAFLGNGHLERVYENALTHRLRKHGMRVAQHPVHVFDEDGALLVTTLPTYWWRRF